MEDRDLASGDGESPGIGEINHQETKSGEKHPTPRLRHRHTLHPRSRQYGASRLAMVCKTFDALVGPAVAVHDVNKYRHFSSTIRKAHDKHMCHHLPLKICCLSTRSFPSVLPELKPVGTKQEQSIEDNPFSWMHKSSMKTVKRKHLGARCHKLLKIHFARSLPISAGLPPFIETRSLSCSPFSITSSEESLRRQLTPDCDSELLRIKMLADTPLPTIVHNKLRRAQRLASYPPWISSPVHVQKEKNKRKKTRDICVQQRASAYPPWISCPVNVQKEKNKRKTKVPGLLSATSLTTTIAPPVAPVDDLKTPPLPSPTEAPGLKAKFQPNKLLKCFVKKRHLSKIPVLLKCKMQSKSNKGEKSKISILRRNWNPNNGNTLLSEKRQADRAPCSSKRPSKIPVLKRMKLMKTKNTYDLMKPKQASPTSEPSRIPILIKTRKDGSVTLKERRSKIPVGICRKKSAMLS